MAAEWFRRLGDVPGLDYGPPVVVDREALPRHDAEPDNRDGISIGGYLSWGTVWEPVRPEEREPDDDEDGGAVWSRDLEAPVTEYLREYLDHDAEHGLARVRAERPLATPDLLRRLWEGLELPGRPYDYHVAIERVREMLFARRLDEAEVMETVESLAWLDVRLVLACPHAVLVQTDEGDEHFYGMSAFDALIRLYQTEGFMREALEVAELAERFPAPAKRVSDLRARLETIRSETVGPR
jgi:hypothetical protein